MRRRFPNSYYKKVTGVFQFEEEKEMSSIEKKDKIQVNDNNDRNFLKSLRKIKSRNE